MIAGGAQGPLKRWNPDGTADAAFGEVDNDSRMNILVDDVIYGLGLPVSRSDGDFSTLRTRSSVTALSVAGDGPAPLSLKNGVLTVQGTSASEKIEFSTFRSHANGTPATLTVIRGFWQRTLPANSINSLVINADGGDDRVFLSTNERPDIKVVINGGPGNDHITAYGNGANTTIHGGPGNDTIIGDFANGSA